MDYKLPVENYLQRIAKSHRFSRYDIANGYLERIKNIVNRYGSITYNEFDRVINHANSDKVVDRWEHEYGWRNVDDAKVVCVRGDKDAESFYISMPRPHVLANDMFPGFKAGNRPTKLKITEYSPTMKKTVPDEIKLLGTRYLSWNQPMVGFKRVVPDYVEFVGEYPNSIDVRAHFESKGGGSYLEGIDKFKIQSQLVTVKEDKLADEWSIDNIGEYYGL